MFSTNFTQPKHGAVVNLTKKEAKKKPAKTPKEKKAEKKTKKDTKGSLA